MSPVTETADRCATCGQPADVHCECCGMCRDEQGRSLPDSYWQPAMTVFTVGRAGQLCSGGREPIRVGATAYADTDGWVWCEVHAEALRGAR